ncbi:hypothetical protein ACVWZV_009462 [Bradyrhizobium sp. GM5.1]
MTRDYDRPHVIAALGKVSFYGLTNYPSPLMAPNLRAKSQAISANLSDEEVFRVRAVSSEVGWFELRWPTPRPQSVSNVELLLSAGASEGPVAIGERALSHPT